MRTRLTAVFCLALLGAWWRTRGESAVKTEIQQYGAALRAIEELLRRNESIIPPRDRKVLWEAAETFRSTTEYWSQASGPSTPVTEAFRDHCRIAMMLVTGVLDSLPEVERIAGEAAAIRRGFLSSGGALLLRFQRSTPDAESIPRFLIATVDPARGKTVELRGDGAPVVYAFVFVENAAPGDTPLEIRLDRSVRVQATVAVPRPGRLTVRIIASGKATPAVAGLYTAGGQLQVPEQAIGFGQGGLLYSDVRFRPYENVRYWPGDTSSPQVFFVDGGFTIEAPAGEYRLVVGKGFEYVPVERAVRASAGETSEEEIALERWIDMPARGWYSGDGHVHYARPKPDANRTLRTWAQAEDVHVVNVLRMGVARRTHFEQYGYGPSARDVSGSYALVAGQEDPRTMDMGHTIQWNILSPVRRPDEYYLYDVVFDEVRRQGGLTGYAHVYQPPSWGFWVWRDMTLNVAAGKVDFAEISEFGQLDTALYYEFLNLGFRLAATAGSDVPWGSTIGASRVYAQAGERFDVDRWFEAVRAGRTFVTTGPMLEFTVNGQPPGAELDVQPGDKLRIRAVASGRMRPPQYLEIVSAGDVVKVASGQDRGEISTELEFTVQNSTWLAARCAGAHTGPVYVRARGKRWWKLPAIAGLVAQRTKRLDEIERFLETGPQKAIEGVYEDPVEFPAQKAELRARVRAARAFYADLLRQAQAEARGRQIGSSSTVLKNQLGKSETYPTGRRWINLAIAFTNLR